MTRRLPFSVIALLAVLTIVVQLATIWAVADPLQAVSAPAPVESAENDAGTAVPIVVLIVVELVLVYGAWLLYGRLPAWLKVWIKRGLMALGAGYALLYALAIMPVLFIVYAAVIIAYATGYAWLAYNIGGLTVGVVIAATLGGYLGPVPLIVLLAGLMVYDWVAVIETTIMERVATILSSTGLPVMVVIPKQLSFDFLGFLDALSNDGFDISDWRDRVHTVIGVGDFAIPAALTAAAFRFHGPAVAFPVLAGTVVGMVMLGRALGDDPLPGLPWLGGGALGGYAASVVALSLTV